jgi:hypothetical protein
MEIKKVGARVVQTLHAIAVYMLVYLFIILKVWLFIFLLERLPLFGMESGINVGWMFIFFRPYLPSRVQSGWMDRLYVLSPK